MKLTKLLLIIFTCCITTSIVRAGGPSTFPKVWITTNTLANIGSGVASNNLLIDGSLIVSNPVTHHSTILNSQTITIDGVPIGGGGSSGPTNLEGYATITSNRMYVDFFMSGITTTGSVLKSVSLITSNGYGTALGGTVTSNNWARIDAAGKAPAWGWLCWFTLGNNK